MQDIKIQMYFRSFIKYKHLCSFHTQLNVFAKYASRMFDDYWPPVLEYYLLVSSSGAAMYSAATTTLMMMRETKSISFSIKHHHLQLKTKRTKRHRDE